MISVLESILFAVGEEGLDINQISEIMELKEEDCVDVNALNLYIKCNDQTLKTKLYP